MKHSEVRNHIIKTASSLFYKKGYNLTGINEIIKEAGIAKATLYNHFPSKEAICIAYLQHKNDTFRKDIQDFVQQASPGNNRILALFDFLKVFFDHKDFNGCWCLNVYSEMPKENENVREEILDQKNSFIDFITTIVEKNCNQSTSEANQMLAKRIYLLYESAISESKIHQSIWPIDASLAICKTLIN